MIEPAIPITLYPYVGTSQYVPTSLVESYSETAYSVFTESRGPIGRIILFVRPDGSAIGGTFWVSGAGHVWVSKTEFAPGSFEFFAHFVTIQAQIKISL